MKEIDDKDVKIALLTSKLEDIFATVIVKICLRFEIRARETISTRLMSADELCEIYREKLELMFGDLVIYSDIYD